jgi:photosystem II stability/assembly factor-like uncharacterized protein
MRRPQILFSLLLSALLVAGGSYYYFFNSDPQDACCSSQAVMAQSDPKEACKRTCESSHTADLLSEPAVTAVSQTSAAKVPCCANPYPGCDKKEAASAAVTLVTSNPKQTTETTSLATATPKKSKPSKERRIKEALEIEKKRTADPLTGEVPKEKRTLAVMQTYEKQQRLQNEGFYNQRAGSIANARWQERGPNNVSGRTRAILIDKNDPSGKTVFAGSATGGLWRTCNINASQPNWVNMSSIWPSMAIGAMAQDPLEPNYIYIGTGDNVDVVGMGVFRSIDGGITFSILPSTLNASYLTIQEMAVDPTNGSVYLGANDGVYRSTNHGDTWTKVLANVNVTDLEITSSGMIYVGSTATLYRSATGDTGGYTNLNSKLGFPGGVQRAEFSICDETPNVIYLTGATGGDAIGVFKTTNGGDSWSEKTMPERQPGTTFATPQAWYDLDIMVDPFDQSIVYVGGIDLFRTGDGGFSWSRISNWAGGDPQYVHADQHYMTFDNDRPGTAFFGNDGGIWRTTSSTSALPPIRSKLDNLNTTTFYAMGMDPGFMSGKFIAGAQDNGTNLVEGNGVGRAREIVGGDGFYCFIDQNEPNILMGSLYDGDWSISLDGGATVGPATETAASFYTLGDYDDEQNILYGQTGNADYFYYKVANGQTEYVNVANVGLGLNASNFFVDLNVPNRIYVGTYGGAVVRIDNANSNNPVVTNMGNFGGTISSIDVAEGEPNKILVTISNYNISNNIVLSTNGGTSWIGCEGTSVPNNLPDMPVRWGLFNPNNSNQVFIATETGVWVTESLNGNNTVWTPPVPNRGIPNVRTDMLQYRKSDKVIGAATFGAGVWTTGVLSDAFAEADFPTVLFANAPIEFSAEQSIGDNTSTWSFGDGQTSPNLTTTHTFAAEGDYVVTLNLNNGESVIEKDVRVIGNTPAPWAAGEANYTGNFDVNDDQYGVYTRSGTAFEYGSSTLPYKNGTHSGAKALVLGATTDFYEDNTETAFYLPGFDFSENGVYEFSFWGKWGMGPGDGLIVEYSTTGGVSWTQLGAPGADWYNNSNQGLETSPYVQNQSFFGGEKLSWAKYRTNVSFLSGNTRVAFRIVFKSGTTGNFRGCVIDDIEVNKYTDQLRTTINNFKVEPLNANEFQLTWSTLPEYYCDKFELEYSENGTIWQSVINGRVEAQGGISADEYTYEFSFPGFKDIYFFRMKVINSNQGFASVVNIDECGNLIGNPTGDYRDTFYTPVVIGSRIVGGEVGIFKIFPNPVETNINILFNSAIQDQIFVELYDMTGRQIYNDAIAIDGFLLNIEFPAPLPAGTYNLAIRIGEDGDFSTYKIQSQE